MRAPSRTRAATGCEALLLLLLLTASGCRSTALRIGQDVGATSVAASRVRVLSLNAWMLPGFSGAMPERLARLPDALKRHEPDLVCLQEIWAPAARARIVEGLGPDFHASDGLRGGLLTLARRRIVEQRFVAFPVMEGLSFEERLAGKGVLLTVLEGPGGGLRVANTHLAWDPSAAGPRARQLAFLSESLAPLTDLPLVLAGDLNTPLNHRDGTLTEAGVALRALGFAHADPLADGRMGDVAAGAERPTLTPTRAGWPPEPDSGWTPDHVLHREGLGRTTLARDYRVIFATATDALSDHSGLRVDLLLAP